MLTNIPLDRPMAVIDLETTGIDTKNDRIVEISVLRLMPQGEPDHRTRRVNPGMPIPAEATAVHGIHDHDVAGLPGFGGIAKGVVQFMDGCDICGFNILGFDLKLLLAEFDRAGVVFPMKGRRVIDVKDMYHRMQPRNLTAAYLDYCGKDHEGAHGAAADVLATAAILNEMVLRHEELPRSVHALHDHLRDPAAVDLGGMFTRRPDGAVAFAKGKHAGMTLEAAAEQKRDYLAWMLSSDFFPDTKEMVREALQEGVPC